MFKTNSKLTKTVDIGNVYDIDHNKILIITITKNDQIDSFLAMTRKLENEYY